MKKLLLIITLTLIPLLSNAQSEEGDSKEIYIFNTYNDFENKNEQHLGTYNAIISSNALTKLEYINQEGKKKKQALKNIWGFRIGSYYFRIKSGRWNTPMYIKGIKNKVFYYKGKLFLDMILTSSNFGSTGNTKNMVLYSDNLNSDFFDIEEMKENESNNPLFLSLVKCIDKGLDRYGYSPQFKAIKSCVDSFLKEEEE